MSKILPSILIVDDDLSFIQAFKGIVSSQYDVYTASNKDLAADILSNEWIQVILCSEHILNTTKNCFYKTITRQYPELVKLIIFDCLMTEINVSDFNRFNGDQYITKTSTALDIRLKLKNGINYFNLHRENQLLSLELKLQPKSLKEAIDVQRKALNAHFSWDEIIRSPNSCMNDICLLIKKISSFDVNVLIIGESGTGKELCAKALHYNSLRQKAPFVAENCGALPDELLESELFGHKKGAFTGAIEDRVGLFESAQGGTIFLDEIGETSPAFQLKLLRVLQEKEVRPLGMNKYRPIDVRIVAATNRNLEEDVRQGRFREDLYYRLTTFSVVLPPLRERLEDIPYIAVNLLKKIQIELGKQVDGFANDAILSLQNYQWPGNVRELENEIKRMLVISQNNKLTTDVISSHIFSALPKDIPKALEFVSDNNHCSLKSKIETLESHVIKESLIRNDWNKTKTADELGLSRVGLRNKLDRYKIKPSEHVVIPLDSIAKSV